MSTIEIKADLDSAEHYFEYRGSDMRDPLERLYNHLMKLAADLPREAGAPPKTPLPTLNNLTKPKPKPKNNIQQHLHIILSDAFEAQLWAQECRRTPDRTWKLTMGKLKWLYRELDPR